MSVAAVKTVRGLVSSTVEILVLVGDVRRTNLEEIGFRRHVRGKEQDRRRREDI